jgi:hypothetical protein
MLPATTAEKPLTFLTPLMGSSVTSAPSPVITLAMRSATLDVTPALPAKVTRIFIVQVSGFKKLKGNKK